MRNINDQLDDLRQQSIVSNQSVTFTVTDPYDVKLLANARELASALAEIKSNVRTMWKHGEYDSRNPNDVVDEIYTMICVACDDVDGDLL